MKIAISAESTIDLPRELLDKYKISTVPFTVIMGKDEYFDGQISNQDIFDFVEKEKILPKTSAVNRFQYEQHFKNLLKTHEAVIHFSLSSGISCAYENAVSVAKELKNVYVIDTASLSTGIALLAIKASELNEKNLPLDDILKTVKSLIEKVQASFIINKLNYLYKGGRCSSLAMLGANVLSIKPQIILSNGKMKVGKKYMGKLENLIAKYCNDTLDACSGFDLSHAFVTYTTASQKMLDEAKKSLISRGFKNIHFTTAGATITSHCGPNTLGILFIKE